MGMEVKLYEICDFINGGAWSQDEYSDTGRLVIRVSDIKKNEIDLSECKYLNLESVSKYVKNELQKDDLVVTTVGSHPNQPNSVVGRTVIIPTKIEGALLNQNAVCIRTNKDFVNQKYICYLAKSTLFKHHIISRARGTANQVRIAIEELKEFKFELPPLPTQQKIANILSAYDDLIANNQARIRILEQMAQNLYKEWFVRFRFPNWEQTEFVEGLPLGWEKVVFTDISNIINGGTPSTKNNQYWNGDIPFFSPKDANDSFYCLETESYITEEGLKNCSSRLFEVDTMFITARGTVGKIALNAVPMAMNQSNYALKAKSGISQEYLFLTTQVLVKRLRKQANGATFSAITVRDFESLKTFLPNAEILKSFDAIINPLFAEIKLLSEKNLLLKQARNRLLPRLMSGKLEV